MENSQHSPEERAPMLDAEALKLVHDYLAGSYSEDGMVTWWNRPRTKLEGLTPAQAWNESRDKVIDLAAAVAGQVNH